jgi:hypothetical protein
MKKFVLSLALLASISIVHAQVYMNEFYVRPGGTNSEYFELYNGSFSSVSLSCYSLVTYFNDGTNKGFYVVNFPAGATIPGHGFYVGSSASPFTYQDGTYTPDLNWNTGYVTQYVYNGSGYTATTGTSGTPFNDIFLKSNGTGNGDNGVYAMFLYNGSTLVDGLLGANVNNTVPGYITGLPDLPASANSCGTISFGGLNNSPDLIANVNESAGTDNGYFRSGDGPCPTNQNWLKSNNPTDHTPGAPNSGRKGGITQNQVFTVNATCTSAGINYTITGGGANLYPLNVTLYNDVNGSGTLDGSDVAIGSNTYTTSGTSQTIANPSNYTFLILAIDAQGVCSDTAVAVQCPGNIILPVSLKSFNVKRNGNSVSVTWETATEINNTGFYVQRLIGNGGWETLGFIPSQANGGNSNSVLSYSYSDLNTAKGVTQYRLRQVDMNGTAKYSEIRTIRSNDLISKLVLFPNPSNTGNISVVFDDASVLRDVYVSDMSGRVLKQWKGVSNNNIQIENLNPGVYTVRVVDTQAGTQTTEKFVISQR